MKLKIASLNMSGAQGKGTWNKFLARMHKLAKEDKVDIILGQEHGLHPSREPDLRRTAQLKGFTLLIAFAKKGRRTRTIEEGHSCW